MTGIGAALPDVLGTVRAADPVQVVLDHDGRGRPMVQGPAILGWGPNPNGEPQVSGCCQRTLRKTHEGVLAERDIDDSRVPELLKCSKEVFDLDSVISAAEELKNAGQLKRLVAPQFVEPEDEWIRSFATRVYDGSFTQKVKAQFFGSSYRKRPHSPPTIRSTSA